jgi:hypothetical protein
MPPKGLARLEKELDELNDKLERHEFHKWHRTYHKLHSKEELAKMITKKKEEVEKARKREWDAKSKRLHKGGKDEQDGGRKTRRRRKRGTRRH